MLQNPFLAAIVTKNPIVTGVYPKPEDAIEAYLRFLYLAAVEPKGAVPNKAVDEIWHGHLTQTRAYDQFCKTVLQKFIHHTPSVDTGSGPDAETRSRFQDTKNAERREFSAESLKPEDTSIESVMIIVVGFVIVAALAFTMLGISKDAFIAFAIHAAPFGIGFLIVIIVMKMSAYNKATEAELAAVRRRSGSTTKKTDASGASGTSGGGEELFFLSGLQGHGAASGDKCAEGTGATAVGGGTGDGDGDSVTDGSSCSSCGGGD